MHGQFPNTGCQTIKFNIKVSQKYLASMKISPISLWEKFNEWKNHFYLWANLIWVSSLDWKVDGTFVNISITSQRNGDWRIAMKRKLSKTLFLLNIIGCNIVTFIAYLLYGSIKGLCGKFKEIGVWPVWPSETKRATNKLKGYRRVISKNRQERTKKDKFN